MVECSVPIAYNLWIEERDRPSPERRVKASGCRQLTTNTVGWKLCHTWTMINATEIINFYPILGGDHFGRNPQNQSIIVR